MGRLPLRAVDSKTKSTSAKLFADPEVSALNAATFAHSLFSLLRLPLLSFTEAFAMANHILRAHGCADTGGKRNPIHPVLDCNEPPELPGTKPQPIPYVEGVDLSLGFSRSVPGVQVACFTASVDVHVCRGVEVLQARAIVLRRHDCHQCGNSRCLCRPKPAKLSAHSRTGECRMGGHPTACTHSRGHAAARGISGHFGDRPPRGTGSGVAGPALLGSAQGQAGGDETFAGDACTHNSRDIRGAHRR
jgi:hypothetical protein